MKFDEVTQWSTGARPTETEVLLSIFRVGGTFRMARMTLLAGGQETSG
jgi:hypothetical protein